MTETGITWEYKTKYHIFKTLSVLATIFPVIFFVIKGLSDGTIGNTEKLSLGLCFMTALIMVLLGTVRKHNLRTPFFVILYGINVCLKDISLVILVIGICTALDEMIFSPLTNKYRDKYTVNKEIDKRL